LHTLGEPPEMSDANIVSKLATVGYFSDVERIVCPTIGFPSVLTHGSILTVDMCAPHGKSTSGQSWHVSLCRGIRRVGVGRETTIDDGTYYFESIALRVENVGYFDDFSYRLSARIPDDIQVDLYDLSVEVGGKLFTQENAVQIVQSFPSQPRFCILSDPHVGFKGYPCIDAPNVDEMSLFRNAIKDINESRPDFVIITGDLVDWSSMKNWKDLRNLLKTFQVPTYTTIGNHDYYWDNWWDGYPPLLPASVRCDPVAIRYYLRHINPHTNYSFDYGPIHAVCLDSGDDAVLAAVEAYGSGLTDDDLAWLENDLQGKEGSLVFMHHPATRAGAEDELKRRANAGCITVNRTEFMDLCAKHHVAAVFSGHEHKDEYWHQDGVDYYTSPSVSRSGENNGYRSVQITVEGTFHTGVVTVSSQTREYHSL